MKKMKHMLVLIDRQPLENPYAYINHTLDNLRWEGHPYRAYQTGQTLISLSVVGPQNFGDQYFITAAALQKFQQLWKCEPNFDNFHYQQFRGSGGNGVVLVEFEAEDRAGEPASSSSEPAKQTGTTTESAIPVAIKAQDKKWWEFWK
jgi:hypothetical protein